MSFLAISFYVLSLLFGPCRLSEFTLAGPRVFNLVCLAEALGSVSCFESRLEYT